MKRPTQEGINQEFNNLLGGYTITYEAIMKEENIEKIKDFYLGKFQDTYSRLFEMAICYNLEGSLRNIIPKFINVANKLGIPHTL